MVPPLVINGLQSHWRYRYNWYHAYKPMGSHGILLVYQLWTINIYKPYNSWTYRPTSRFRTGAPPGTTHQMPERLRCQAIAKESTLKLKAQPPRRWTPQEIWGFLRWSPKVVAKAWTFEVGHHFFWLVVWNIFYDSIYWESASQLTNIFQRGSNHRLVFVCFFFYCLLCCLCFKQTPVSSS